MPFDPQYPQPVLSKLGWDAHWSRLFQEQAPSGLLPARVIAVDRDRATVVGPNGTRHAVLTGKYRYGIGSSLDLPCVGDWVGIEDHGADNPATLHLILPRQTVLRRKAAGKTVDFQLIGANLDGVFVVQSCHFDFNPRRLERYLVMASEGGIEPMVVLSKTDLVDAETLTGLIAKIRGMGIEAQILPLSNVSGEGVEVIKALMLPDQTYALVGSSGVGKTTLINRLLEGAELETQEVSASGEGRHTTVRRELIELNSGALLIDTPGMRELGILGGEQGIEARYGDIEAIAAHCRFKDCRHEGEPGCAVASAIASGELDPDHLRNYQKIRAEAEHHDMSFAQKREKDKAFGRFLHKAKKDFSKR